MSHTNIIATLSLLASGALALAGCDKEQPVTEVPASADLSPVDGTAVENPDPTSEESDDDRELTEEVSAEAAPPEVAVAAEASEAEVVEASEAEPEPAQAVDAQPKPRPKPRPKKKKRARARASKGEAACGEGTCG